MSEDAQELEIRQANFRRAQKLRTQIRKLREDPYQIALLAILRTLGVEIKREKVAWISDASWQEVLEIGDFPEERMHEMLNNLEAALRHANNPRP